MDAPETWLLIGLAMIVLGLAAKGLGAWATDAALGMETREAEANRELMARSFGTLADFSSSKVIYAHRTAVAVDTQRRLLAWPSEKDATKPVVYPYGALLSVALSENGATVTQVSRPGQIAGALVGGVVAGTVGAIIGGTTASSVGTTQSTGIHLHITVRDMDQPLHTLRFMPPRDTSYASEPGRAREILALLQVAINQADDPVVESVTRTSAGKDGTSDGQSVST